MNNIILTGDTIRQTIAPLWGTPSPMPGTWIYKNYIIWDMRPHNGFRMYSSDSVSHTIIIYNSNRDISDYIVAVEQMKGSLHHTTCLILSPDGQETNNVIRKCKHVGIKCFKCDIKTLEPIDHYII